MTVAPDLGDVRSQLYKLFTGKYSAFARVAGINDLDGMAIVNSVKYYAALGSDLGVVRETI